MTEATQVDLLEKQAQRLYRHKKLSEAISTYQQVLSEEETRSSAHIGLAASAFLLKDYDLAAKHFERAIQLSPSNGKLLINLGAVYNKLERYLEAAATLRKGLLRERKSVEGHFNIAFANRQLKQYALSVSSYREAINLDPEFVDAYVNLGEVYTQMGNFQQAMVQLNKALDIRPDYPRALKAIEEAKGASQTAKSAFSPFGRLVTEEQLAANQQESTTRDLDETERIKDRQTVFDITRDLEGLTTDFVKLIQARLEEKVTQLHKAVLHEGEAPTELYSAQRQFKDAFDQFREMQSVLKAKTDELREHENSMKSPTG
ncbi:MAG: tetratricopeptide repeat protein [Planctomycetaceae bacterium]